jgi:hypothetical protein
MSNPFDNAIQATSSTPPSIPPSKRKLDPNPKPISEWMSLNKLKLRERDDGIVGKSVVLLLEHFYNGKTESRFNLDEEQSDERGKRSHTGE